MSNSLYFKQVEIGPMSNFVYLVGSTETRKVAVIDAAWDIEGILGLAAADGMEITHALVTHTHPDHVGSWLRGAHIPGSPPRISSGRTAETKSTWVGSKSS